MNSVCLSLWSQATCVLRALGRDLQDSTPSCPFLSSVPCRRNSLEQSELKYPVFGTLPCGPANLASYREPGVGGCLCPDVLGDTSHTACPLCAAEAT